VRLIILPFGVTLLSLVLIGAAGAQTLRIPLVEVGGEGGLLGAVAEGLYLNPIVGPRLTFNLTQRDAIELAMDTLVPYEYGTYGFYIFQYKRTTRRPPDWSGIRPFFTAGTGGSYYYRKIPERRLGRPDGSVAVYPAHATGWLSRLSVAAVGGGFERGLNRHVSFRLEGGGILVLHNDGFLGFRVLAGVSVPIGGYGATTTR
jgi:hypothetical protein